MGSRTDAEDEKKAVGMPSFDPQLPISNAMYSSPSITFCIRFQFNFSFIIHLSTLDFFVPNLLFLCFCLLICI
jgi:hypothetical protein